MTSWQEKLCLMLVLIQKIVQSRVHESESQLGKQNGNMITFGNQLIKSSTPTKGLQLVRIVLGVD